MSNIKEDNEYSVNPRQFINIVSPVTSYLLGLIWADGYIKIKLNDKKKFDRIEISMLTDDMKFLLPLFNSTGKWCIYSRHRPNRKPSTSVITNNRVLANFLSSNDYTIKSSASACKILSLIPDDLKKYWFRGVIDGDGCFYINKETKQVQFSITSNFNQNWKYFKTLLKHLNIKFSIQKMKRKCGSHSSLRITNAEGIICLGDYVYAGILEDKIGLSRKFEKYLNIKSLKLHLSRNYRNNFENEFLHSGNS